MFSPSPLYPSPAAAGDADVDVDGDVDVDVDVDVEFDYDNFTKESYPYPVYTVRRIWKGIPLSQAASFKDDNEMHQAIESQKIGEEIK